jgi:predicted nucleotidyltransferase
MISWKISAMRLAVNEVDVIREEIRQFDPAAEIYLYGSRVDDAARGGDIDLLVLSDKLGFRDVLRLRTRILDRIGWQQLDLLVRQRNQPTDPITALALETGTKL